MTFYHISSPSFPFLFRLSFRGSAFTFPIHHALHTDPPPRSTALGSPYRLSPRSPVSSFLRSFLLSASSSSSCLPASARTHPRPRSAPPHPQSGPKSARPLPAGRQVGRLAATDTFHSILVLGILCLLGSCCPRQPASPILCFFDPGNVLAGRLDLCVWRWMQQHLSVRGSECCVPLDRDLGFEVRIEDCEEGWGRGL
jgi:hypothetical protein